MKVDALPRYKVLGAFLSLLLAGCFILTVTFFPQPAFVIGLMLPLLGICVATFATCYLDQNGVVYETTDEGVLLLRHGHRRKLIRFDTIRSIHNQGGTLVLRKKGFWAGSQLLHPSAQIVEFMNEIEVQIQNKPLRLAKARATKALLDS